MSSIHSPASVLPMLRPDIEFFPGPDDSDGSPTSVIHDPLRGTYEKATWVQTQILRLLRAPLTVERLLEQLSAHTTIRVSRDDVRQLCVDASRKGLTMDSLVAAEPPAARTRQQGGMLGFLVRSLIYVRIPLVRPDAFLDRTVGMARHLAGPVAWTAYLCLALVGLSLVAQRFDAYCATFPRFFNLKGAACFALAITGVKVVHELSHAYTAKAFGSRVASIGLSLSRLLPLAYTDVTDSWRMRSRRQRLLISLAGVIAELVIAGLALFVWAISPPGILKSICFVVSSATLLSTFLVNLNPLMRFDGYYVMSDLLGIDNLQSRSSAVARWYLRRRVLGMKIEAPEHPLPSRRMAVMIVYAISTWIYRLFLYSAIALFLYSRFTKVIGGLLFVWAIYTFVIKPVVWEALGCAVLGKRLGWNPRMALALLAIGLGLAWAAWPMARWHSLPATTVPINSQMIYAPNPGVIRELSAVPGGAVRRGQSLLTIESRDIDTRIRLARLEMQRIGIELAGIGTDEKHRALVQTKKEELARAGALLETALAMGRSNRIVAEVEGKIVDWDESLRQGTPVGSDQILGRIVALDAPLVLCYVRQDLVQGLKPGDRVYFVSRADSACRSGWVANVDPVRTSVLRHSGLASVSGGDLAVVPDAQGRLQMVDSYYEVDVRLEQSGPPLRVGQTGRVWIRTAPRSRLVDLLRHLHKTLVRESSF